MVIAKVWSTNLNDWHGQLFDNDTNQEIGQVWSAPQRGALIGQMSYWIPLTHLTFIDVGWP